MFNLGKKRSKFGKFVDDHIGYGGQERVREVSKVSRDVVRKVCSDANYKPTGSIRTALVAALKELTGKNVKSNDFWTM